MIFSDCSSVREQSEIDLADLQGEIAPPQALV